MSFAQITLPLLSVVSFPALLNKVQFTEAIESPPVSILIPAKVELADVLILVVSTPPPKVVVPRPTTVSAPREEVAAERSEVEATLAKKLVDVEFVVVELTPVKF